MIEFKGYKESNDLFFPAHDVAPATKLTPAWNVKYAKAMYWLYLNSQCTINYSDLAQIRRLRSYGNGCQDITQYMDRMGFDNQVTVTGEGLPSTFGAGATATSARKGYSNINFNILKIAPKFKTIVVGTFEDVEHDVFADGVDEKSGSQRLADKNRLWIEMKFKEQFAQFEQAAGVSLNKPEYIPETEQELEMFAQMGGFKLQSEISIESALQYTLFLSRWKEVKRKLITDLFEIGRAGVRDEVDPNTQKVYARYCDPECCVIPYSRSTDYRNMPFAGEFIFKTIAEIRALGVFSDEELHTIATAYEGYLGNNIYLATVNGGTAGIGPYQYSSTYNYVWNQFRIAILDCEFKSDDYKYTTVSQNEDGSKTVRESKFGKERSSDKRKTEKTKTLMVYKCKWIVGTDLCYDYGHAMDIVRPTPSEANLSFHFSRIEGPSMTEMMIEPLDQFQLGFLRAQNAIATAAPSGLAIDIGTLDNVTMGGKKLHPLELFKIRNHTGHQLYAATTHRNYQPTATGYKPIQELAGGAGQNLVEALQYMEKQIMLIQDITGISRVAAAGNPQADDLVGVTELSLQATATALRPLFSQYVSVKERMCQNAALRIQLLVKVNKVYEGQYVMALGAAQTQTLKIGSEINNAMFNIRIQARPSVEEKLQILEAAQVSLQTGRNGQIGISTSDYFTIVRFINQGMLKMAEVYLAFKERKAKEEAEVHAKEMVAEQGKQNLELEKQKAQAAQMLLDQQKANLELEYKLKTQFTLVTDNNAHKNKMEELGFTETTKRQTVIETNDATREMNTENNHTKLAQTGIQMSMDDDKHDIEREKIEADKEMAKNKPEPKAA